MRDKTDILKDLNKERAIVYTNPPWERKKDFILIEVLIDIRDLLNFQLKDIDRSIQGIPN